ncbi:MAG: aspartate aminotransferase family protein [Flavobacteriia bacterium]|nr:aspartate aminotransferase family protein [Flavobacteriia bacterium]
MKNKEEFLAVQAQTNTNPFLLEIENAKGVYLFDKNGKSYMDMISGVGVANIGHQHPKVIQAIKKQADKYLHVMVYGEFIQEMPLKFSKKITSLLPSNLNCVYPVNSGTEANEAAIKLVKRVTKRSEIISFRGSYHGSTHGSLSVSGNEIKKRAFRPLLPDVRFLEFNNTQMLEQISDKTAGVIMETVQGDAGVRIPTLEFISELRKKCSEVGALLIFDEIQCGMGRTGKLFAFEHFNVVPDILTLGKAIGGGLPMGVLVSSHENLQEFTTKPNLGHITTFGGNPLICASALATLQVFSDEIDFEEVEKKAKILEKIIISSNEIKSHRRIGMFYAFDMESAQRVEKVVKKCLELGVISFWFLSHPYSFRIAPPLNISYEEIEKAAQLILKAIEETNTKYNY